ncbi:MAG: MBL fold metallo-hydrolase [Polyangiaceae bacterium]|jgi:glyoxylase-like metal-dependent hydrolase (beta-lactamase superfamily II)|nr:MBL fold metallo-hydrolase [Polyangiaceae bacterium]
MDARRSTLTIDCDYVLPRFAAAYLRVENDEAAFIETNTTHAAPRLLQALDEAGLRPEQVRWVIVTHVHLDHAGGASALMKALPGATLLAHPRAARHLIDPSKLVASATQVYGAETFERLYGAIEPIPEARVRVMDDGTAVDLGGVPLQFFHTRGHANHHFVVADPAASSVFTGDTFGLAYPRLQRAGRLAFPSTSPTDYDGAEARRSVERVIALGVERAYLTHFGEVNDLRAVGDQLLRWIDLSDQLVAGAAALPPEQREGWIRRHLGERMDEEASRVGLTLDADDRSLLELDLQLNAQGLAFVAGKRAAG